MKTMSDAIRNLEALKIEPPASMEDLYEITAHGPIRHSNISPKEEIFEI
ncbi:hypothetical protein ILT44_13455 [Microvirga sp. BT689]|nr:hypothetical protein [Microvirga arvi]MBM6581196.1 hypothetical protein [Microvirga arvi]